MNQFTLTCPCHFGLEKILAGEIKRMGADVTKTIDGRVTFSGDMQIIARANLCLRTAERVLVLVGEFKALTFDALFEGVKSLPWENYIAKTDAFPVKGHSMNSQLHSIPSCQSIIKKAVVERLKGHYHLSWLEETTAKHQIQFFIHKNNISVYLDTSGEGLHKRGYRKNANQAPIRETLAAGIVDLARVKQDAIVYDPFCGSGTFLIEAATKALRIQPGMMRSFAAEQWSQIPSFVWRTERERARDLADLNGAFHAFGTDIDEKAIELSAANAKKASVASRIQFYRQAIDAFLPKTSQGIVFANPPYGERMLEMKLAREIYRQMGEVFAKRDSYSYYIITSDDRFESYFGRKADKKRKLYNGMRACQLYMYFK